MVVNEALVEESFKNEDPIGKRLIIGRGVMREFADEPEREIIGVVGDVRDNGLNQDPRPKMYIPQPQVPDEVNALNVRITPVAWVIRTRVPPLSVSAQVQEVLRQATGLPVSDIRSMDEVVTRSTSRERFNMLLMSVFGGSALLLSAIGIYGLMAYSVEQRAQEIGIRIALGAQARRGARMIIRQGMILAAIGIVIGIAGAYGLSRFIESFLYSADAARSGVFIGAPVLLAAVAFLATWIPALRAPASIRSTRSGASRIAGMMKARASAALGLFLVSLAAAAPAAAQWGQFRGPNGAGVDTAPGYPSAFSPTDHVVWKAAMPFAQSSPVVAGRQVYVTASEGERLLTICLDAATGRELWRREIKPDRAAAALQGQRSRVADAGGRRPRRRRLLRAMSGSWPTRPTAPSAGAPARALQELLRHGRLADHRRRRRHPGLRPDERLVHGRARSPDRTRALAPRAARRHGVVDDADGVRAGRTAPTAARSCSARRGWTATPSPPVSRAGGCRSRRRAPSARAIAHGDMVIVATLASNTPWMRAFESALTTFDTNKDGKLSKPSTRSRRASASTSAGWMPTTTASSTEEEWNTTRDHGHRRVRRHRGRQAGRRSTASSIRPRSAWRFKKNLPFVPTPVVYDGLVYMVKAGGIVTAIDPATGEAVKEGRSKDAPGDYTASPIAADGKVFLASVNGKITVLKAGREWDVLGVNDLGDEIHATPALSGGRLYVRTRGALYCFGGAKS